MATRYISETQLAGDTQAVLDQIEKGAEIVVERSSKPIAVIKPVRAGRPIAECIERARAYEKALGYQPVADPAFAEDVRAAIEAHREPLEPPAWD